MSRVLKGVIENGQVRLVENAGLPEGTPVTIQVETRMEKKLAELFGACGDDPSLKEIFAEVSGLRRVGERPVPSF
ncbi:MAG: DUF104 domain-containing protein [Nitrospirae bacterium]|nr:DUF104 domain-containing protein [Nitrospirota bacterium]